MEIFVLPQYCLFYKFLILIYLPNQIIEPMHLLYISDSATYQEEQVA